MMIGGMIALTGEKSGVAQRPLADDIFFLKVRPYVHLRTTLLMVLYIGMLAPHA